jgi:small subunit ribosomal protein S8
MMTDPIADLLVRLQNAADRSHPSVTVPASKLKAEILRVLKAEGFVSEYEQTVVDGHPALRVQLRYVAEGQPVITGMRRVSRPGRRVYVGRRDVNAVMGGLGLALISTSRGVMTDHESRRQNLGGEVLCEVW